MGDQSLEDDLSSEGLDRVLAAQRREEQRRRFRAIVEAEERKEAWLGEELPDLRRPPSQESGQERYRPPEQKGEAGDRIPSLSPEATPYQRARPKFLPPSRSEKQLGKLRDRFLLLVEVGAFLALTGVILASFSNLRLLNREVAQTRERWATSATSTPLAILPGSSSPPTPEMPAPYEGLVAPSTSFPIPTPGPQQASRILIPAIGVDAPVVEGDGWEEMKMGVGHHIGSANPGERGNMVLSGHDDVFGEVFRDLGELEVGDEITVYAGETPYKYMVVRTGKVVQPTEVSVMAPTTEATLTLITCYPYLIDTHRLVVIAELEGQ